MAYLTVSRLARLAAMTALIVAAADASWARGRGGGARGGGSMSMSRGGGGGGGGFNRSGSGFGSSSFNRSGTGAGASQRASGVGASQRPSAGQLPAGQRPNQGQRPGGGNNINNGNINNGNINRGDINRGDINIDVDNDWGGWGRWHDRPIGAGIAIGAVAGMTAAAIGSAYYALPPGCPPYYWSGYTYYTCGGAYYAPRYQGDTIVYVTVADPSKQK